MWTCESQRAQLYLDHCRLTLKMLTEARSRCAMTACLMASEVSSGSTSIVNVPYSRGRGSTTTLNFQDSLTGTTGSGTSGAWANWNTEASEGEALDLGTRD